MKKITSILLIPAFFWAIHCSTTTNIKLFPVKESSDIETIWKNKTVGKSSEFSITVSDFILENRTLMFLKDGKPIGKVEMEIAPSVPLLFLGWLGFGIPYLWVASVRDYQTFDISNDLKRNASETSVPK